MANSAHDAPDVLPMLSRGKHRSPRKGGCFMEVTSFLAGERWSDHPSCTHPLLAALARHVNDLTSDAARPRLAPLIPSVIGVTSDDPHLDVRVVLRATTTALPVVSEERQRVLALSVIASEGRLAVLDGRPVDAMEPRSREALDAAPGAEQWAHAFRARVGGERVLSAKTYRRYAAPQALRCATEGIARACVRDPERLLHDLLGAAIEDCRQLVGLSPVPTAAAAPVRWDEATRLVGAAPAR